MKKIISLVLTITLIFGSTLPVFSKEIHQEGYVMHNEHDTFHDCDEHSIILPDGEIENNYFNDVEGEVFVLEIENSVIVMIKNEYIIIAKTYKDDVLISMSYMYTGTKVINSTIFSLKTNEESYFDEPIEVNNTLVINTYMLLPEN